MLVTNRVRDLFFRGINVVPCPHDGGAAAQNCIYLHIFTFSFFLALQVI